MNYQKNDILTVTIEDMGHDGEGIGKADGYTLFVKDAVIGDVIEAKIMKAKDSRTVSPSGGAGLSYGTSLRGMPAADDGLSGAAAFQTEKDRGQSAEDRRI